jgi:hypothetical protein
MTGRPDDTNPLEPLLRDAEEQLRRRLHEACEAEATGVRHKSADEIRRLEDSLLAAAMAAEQTITLRRHLRKQNEGGKAQAAPAPEPAPAGEPANDESANEEPASEEQPAQSTMPAVREFRDREGRSWRAWPVTPGVARGSRKTHYLGEFQQGWICFEALDSPARRRLPCARSRWEETEDERLDELLSQAIMVPERRRKDGAH